MWHLGLIPLRHVGLNPRSLHWKAYSPPLDHQGSPPKSILNGLKSVCYTSWMHHESLSKSFLEHAGYFFSLLIINLVHLFFFSLFFFFLNNILESTVFLFFLSPLRTSVSHSPPRCWYVICPGPGFVVTLSTYIMLLFGAMTACFPHCSDVIQTRVTWDCVSRVCGPHRLPLPS